MRLGTGAVTSAWAIARGLAWIRRRRDLHRLTVGRSDPHRCRAAGTTDQ